MHNKIYENFKFFNEKMQNGAPAVIIIDLSVIVVDPEARTLMVFARPRSELHDGRWQTAYSNGDNVEVGG